MILLIHTWFITTLPPSLPGAHSFLHSGKYSCVGKTPVVLLSSLTFVYDGQLMQEHVSLSCSSLFAENCFMFREERDSKRRLCHTEEKNTSWAGSCCVTSPRDLPLTLRSHSPNIFLLSPAGSLGALVIVILKFSVSWWYDFRFRKDMHQEERWRVLVKVNKPECKGTSVLSVVNLDISIKCAVDWAADS